MPRPPPLRPFRPLAEEVNLSEISRVAGLLVSPTRLCLLAELAKGEAKVADLVARVRLPQPTVSSHLAILRHGGLVTRRREGKAIFYTLAAGGEARVGIRLGATWVHLSVGASARPST